MFYRWIRVKRVMAELWDPDDLTVCAGRKALAFLYDEQLCPDRDVRETFRHLCEVNGEETWQLAAERWAAAVDRHIDGLEALPNTGKLRLKQQVREILIGRRLFLQ